MKDLLCRTGRESNPVVRTPVREETTPMFDAIKAELGITQWPLTEYDEMKKRHLNQHANWLSWQTSRKVEIKVSAS